MPVAVPLGASLLLVACSRYEAQDIDQQQWHRELMQQRADELSIDVQEFDLSDGCNLQEAEVLALLVNPEIRLSRLKAGMPAIEAKHVGRWADPNLTADAKRVMESVDDPWEVNIGLSVTIPVSGSKKAAQMLAHSKAAAALAELQAAEWALRMQVRRAMVIWSTGEREQEVLSHLQQTMQGVVHMAKQMRSMRSLSQADYARLQLKKIEISSRLAAIKKQQDLHRLALLRLLGLSPVDPLAFKAMPAEEWEAWDVPDGDAAILQHPAMQQRLAAYVVSERALALAVRQQYPDLQFGLTAGVDGGATTIGGLLGVIPLPVWNRQRQSVARAETERQIEAMAVKAALASLVHRVAAARTTVDKLTAELASLAGQVVPLVQRQVKVIADARRLGQGDVQASLQAAQSYADTLNRLLQVQREHALAKIELIALLDAAEPTKTSVRQAEQDTAVPEQGAQP